VASTLKNGPPTNWANLRAISVLPTPVVPIMMLFLGVTSLRISGASCCLRQRFLHYFSGIKITVGVTVR